MQTKVDLHSHSTASDGTKSPEELVEMAVDREISILAITDHDTMDGIPAGMKAADSMGITMIPGVELSVNLEENGLTVHLLGYFPGISSDRLVSKSTPLGEALAFVQNGRERRNTRILDKLSNAGINIDMNTLMQIAGGNVIGRPHIAEAMILGHHVDDINEAFSRYLAKGKPAYVERDRLSIDEAIHLISDSDGLSVMAHPGYTGMDLDELRIFFRRMKNHGLVGIEVYYPSHSSSMTDFLRELAGRLELVVTGGTDYHGIKKDSIPLGGIQDGFHVTLEMVKDFITLCMGVNKQEVASGKTE